MRVTPGIAGIYISVSLHPRKRKAACDVVCHARGARVSEQLQGFKVLNGLAAGLGIGLDDLRVGVLIRAFHVQEPILETHAMSASRSSHLCFEILEGVTFPRFNRE
jgi:hypothetical protein